MGGAFLRAMAIRRSQSEAFFDALSSRELKMRLYMVKMMSYNEFFFCFCQGGWGNKKAQLRLGSRPGTGGRATGSR